MGTSNSIQTLPNSSSSSYTTVTQSDFLHINEEPLPNINEEGEAIGIITLEDVIEELLLVIILLIQIQ